MENWALINQTTRKVDSDYKKMKIDWFILNKIILGIVQGDQFLYISLKFDYKLSSRLLQYFSLNFSTPFPSGVSYVIYLPLNDLGPLLVSRPSHYLSACPIRHPYRPSVRLGDQGSTIQGSYPHKCSQRVSYRAFNAVVAAFS